MTDRLDVVSNLDFGRDNAEHDAVDGLLNEGFLATTAFEETLHGRKTLVVGRKGSGKSAICVRLANPEVGQGYHLLITPDAAAVSQLREFEVPGLTGDVAKSLIWRYVFAIHIARHVVAGHARDAHGTREPRSVRRVRTFLRKNGELDDARLHHRIAMATKGLRGSFQLDAFGVVSLSAELGSSPESVRATEQLAVIERGVAQALADLSCAEAHRPLLLLVDKLEQVWTAEPDSEALITGLLVASKELPVTYGRAARCVVFLRSDIYDALTFSEADKFHSDEIRIDWTSDQLAELAVARAAASLGSHVDAEYLWGTVFPATVSGRRTATYLLTRALPRPRDVIQFLNLCRDTARLNRHDRIEDKDVLEATLGFSRWKVVDLAREYGTSLPFLDRLLIMFQNGPHFLSRSTVAGHLGRFGADLRAEFPAYRDVLTPDGIVDVLFRVGFLGVKRGPELAYVTNSTLSIRPGEDEFHIHLCFRPGLNIRIRPLLEPRKPGPKQDYGAFQTGAVHGNVHIGHAVTNDGGYPGTGWSPEEHGSEGGAE